MVLLASDYDKSKYLRAEDLKQETKYRIKDITEETFDNNGKSEKKPVLWFTRGDQGLVLGAKTNLRTLSGAWGDVMDGWKGKIIILFPIMTEVRGQIKAAIRVRIPPPKSPQQAAQSAPTPKGDGAASPAPSQSSGNGAAASSTSSQSSGNSTAVAATVAAAAVPAAVVDPELEPDPVKTHDEEMDDEIPF